ncbi:MAG: TauD/TfdA family dioxygenase [Rhodospirillales bacterium]|nr:TauD/TfdA family dioxygenase [Rhodospirillales bacterium]
MRFEVTSLSPGFGGEITGLDLSQPLTRDEFEEVKKIYFEKEVVVFRDQNLTPGAQADFSRGFGDLMIHVLTQFQIQGHEEVLELSNRRDADGKAIGFEDAGRYWHSDISYNAEPALGTMLYAVEIPPEGGDTLFADMSAAYEALPENIKRRIEGKRAYHSYTINYKANESDAATRPDLTAEQLAKLEDVLHPIVRTHEDTGRKALFVNPGFTYRIEGVSEAESDELLQMLFAHAAEERFIYRHKWRAHDLVCWDNRSTVHHATVYDGKYTRHMHRTTIQGPRPV